MDKSMETLEGFFSSKTDKQVWLFDRSVDLCKTFLQCDGSMLTVIDEEENFQLFKASIGLEDVLKGTRKMPLSHSLCKDVINNEKPLIINAGHSDSIYRKHPAVTEAGVLAYLGVPVLKPDGSVFGSLCAVNKKNREWKKEDIDFVLAASENLTVQLKLMRSIIKASKASAEFSKINEAHALRNGEVSVSIAYETDGSCNLIDVKGDTHKMWGMCPKNFLEKNNLWENADPIDAVVSRMSFGVADTLNTPWRSEWSTKTASGKEFACFARGKKFTVVKGNSCWEIIISRHRWV